MGRKKRQNKSKAGERRYESGSRAVDRGKDPAIPLASAPVLWISLALAALVAAAYAQVRNFEFVYLDDHVYIKENAHVLAGLSRAAIRWALTAQYAGNWHPLTWMSHMADVTLFGVNAGGHHLTSVLFHVVNSVLLFLLIYRMTSGLGRSAIVAGLFAMHPLHVESVAWVSERKDVLSTFFWFCALHAYVSYGRQRSIVKYLGVALFFALGLMSKPMIVTLPFTLLLLDYWPLRRVESSDPRDLRAWMPLLREKIPLFAMTVCSMLITVKSQSGEGAVVRLEEYSVAGRILNAISAYVEYLRDLIWPAGLAGFYPFHPRAAPYAIASACMLLGITAIVILNRRRRPYLAFGWAWYIGTLVPVIGLVQVGDQARADRYTYVPAVGIFIALVWGLWDLSERLKARKLVMTAVGLAAVATLSIVTVRQVSYWRDNVSLFTRILNVTERNYRAEALLGVALAARERHQEAMQHYKASLAIWPGNAEVYTNMGASLVALGKPDEALQTFAEAIRYKPDVALYHYNYGVMLDMKGQTREALEEVRKASALDPASRQYQNGVAVLSAKLKG